MREIAIGYDNPDAEHIHDVKCILFLTSKYYFYDSLHKTANCKFFKILETKNDEIEIFGKYYKIYQTLSKTLMYIITLKDVNNSKNIYHLNEKIDILHSGIYIFNEKSRNKIRIKYRIQKLKSL